MNSTQQNLFKLGAAYYPDYISNEKTLTRRVDSGRLEWLTNKERLTEDFKRMVKQGIHTIRLGEFSWAKVEPAPGVWKPEVFKDALDLAHKHNIEVIFCTPTATPPKWLIDAHPDILPVTRTGQKIPFGSRRHYDFHHPEYQKQNKRITELFAKSFGNHPAVKSWQTDNEFGCHNSVFLFTQNAKTAFHKWLEQRYNGEIEALNENWFTCFWSQHYRSFKEIDLPLASWADQNPHLELDFRRFSNEALCAFQRDQIEIIRKHSPNRPVTHNLMTLFTDLCPWMASKDLDYSGFDHYQMESEPHPVTSAWQFALMRSTKQRHFLILEQQPLQVNWQPTNRRFSFDWLFLWGLQSAFQGASGMLYFSWQRMPGGCEQYHDGVVPHDVRIEKSQQEKLIEAKNHTFTKLKNEFGFTDALPLAARDVLCIHDSESLWSHEITSQSVTYTTRKQIDHITQFCLQSGLGLWFAPSLEAEKDRLDAYKLIVLPGHAFELTAAERHLLKNFRSKGGRVLSLPRTGYKTRNNKLSPLPAVFYSETDFYLDDYGALLESETETCDLTDTAAGGHIEGHLWSEKIQVLNKSWTTEATFSNKSIYAGSPAILKLKEDGQHGAHVHLATCPMPQKEAWSALRKILDLPARAISSASELQLQLLESGNRKFLAGVHFGQHPSSISLPAQQKIGSSVLMSLDKNLQAQVELITQSDSQSLSIPGRSAILVELLT
ncbi:MAG: beta-galactosidase [Betaproteobacteria bacterium]|nr:beta-galactosidase [Betaproteobacteria bacterium]